MITGQLISGICQALIIVPSLPEMIDSVGFKYPGLDADVAVQASGLFTSFLASGLVLGPIYGTWAVEKFGFRLACDTLGMAFLIAGVLHLLLTSEPAPKKDKPSAEDPDETPLLENNTA